MGQDAFEAAGTRVSPKLRLGLSAFDQRTGSRGSEFFSHLCLLTFSPRLSAYLKMVHIPAEEQLGMGGEPSRVLELLL